MSNKTGVIFFLKFISITCRKLWSQAASCLICPISTHNASELMDSRIGYGITVGGVGVLDGGNVIVGASVSVGVEEGV